jgi:hypothetical protein
MITSGTRLASLRRHYPDQVQSAGLVVIALERSAVGSGRTRRIRTAAA